VDKTITIKGDSRVRTITNNGAGALFLSSGVGALFTVPELITLVLDNNITLDGNNQNNRIVYVNGGSLVMKSGSTARGAKSAAGVVVENKGVFTMSGGTISGNTYGGVRVISGNFTMTGGTINGNSTSAGGGVNVDGGAFTMSGGTISGNTAEEGGGVCLNSGAFRMTGGTISGNSAAGVLLTKGGGGGVMVNSGAFTMSGGTISGNTASARGGGVEVYGGTFNKSGGGAIDNTNRARSGRVVFISTGRNKRRKTTAGPTVNLDSSVSGNAGGWE
jgi:hypothetical protein